MKTVLTLREAMNANSNVETDLDITMAVVKTLMNAPKDIVVQQMRDVKIYLARSLVYVCPVLLRMIVESSVSMSMNV